MFNKKFYTEKRHIIEKLEFCCWPLHVSLKKLIFWTDCGISFMYLYTNNVISLEPRLANPSCHMKQFFFFRCHVVNSKVIRCQFPTVVQVWYFHLRCLQYFLEIEVYWTNTFRQVNCSLLVIFFVLSCLCFLCRCASYLVLKAVLSAGLAFSYKSQTLQTSFFGLWKP